MEAGVLRPLDPLAFSQISLDFEAQRFVEVQASILLWFSNAQVLFSNPVKESLGFKAGSSRFFFGGLSKLLRLRSRRKTRKAVDLSRYKKGKCDVYCSSVVPYGTRFL